MRFVLLFVVLFFVFAGQMYSAYAQEIVVIESKVKRLGVVYGYGPEYFPFHNNTLNNAFGIDGKYSVSSVQAQYYQGLYKYKLIDTYLVFLPQFNVSHYKESSIFEEFKPGYEFGVNLGFLLQKELLNSHLNLFTILSLGPHYISGGPTKQATGFIFSDNVFVGLDIKLSKNIFFDA